MPPAYPAFEDLERDPDKSSAETKEFSRRLKQDGEVMQILSLCRTIVATASACSKKIYCGDQNKYSAALNFCFFCFNAKERAFAAASKRKCQI
jgi:hypothetical protein